MSTYQQDDAKQSTLPHVRGESSDGQIELVEPGPRVEAASAEQRPIDPRQCWLPGVPGVRVGANWIRESAKVPHVPWQQLDLRLRGMHKHRGRTWTPRDDATMRSIELQCWGIVELGHRNLTVPQWMRAPVLDTPDGELEIGKNGKPMRIVLQAMLAWIWASMQRGAGGVYMTRAQWAEVLGCSSRSVHNHRRFLEERGLIRVIATHAPASFGKAGARAGSQDAPNLYRIGPALDSVMLAAFDAHWMRVPKSVSRADARELASVLRGCTRAAGRAYQHADRQARARWQQSSDGRRADRVSGRAIDGSIPLAGRSAAPTVCAGMAKSTNLPSLHGVQSSGGAAPREGNASVDRTTADAVGSTAVATERPSPTIPAARADVGPTAAQRRAAAPDARPSNASRRRAPCSEQAPRKRTWLDAAAEAARAFGFSSIGESADHELGDRTSERTMPAARDERSHDERYQAALASLQREHERGLPLFERDD